MHNYSSSIGEKQMKPTQEKQSRWVDAHEVDLDKVSRFTALDIFGSIVLLGLAFGIVAPFLI